MKRISLLAVLIAGVLASCLLAAEGPNTLDLDGREVVVWVHKGRSPEGGTISEKATLLIKGRKIKFDFEDVNDSARITIHAAAQTDEVVRQAIEHQRQFAYRKGREYFLPFTSAELEGRKAVVRVYKDVRDNPAVYETTTVEVSGRRITFDLNDVEDPNNTAVAVAGQDQTDDAIRQSLRCETTVWLYRKEMRWALPREPPESSDEELMSWTFLDGLGNPIPDANVKVYFVPENRRVLVEEGQLDTQGQIRAGFCVGTGVAAVDGWVERTAWPVLVISHPEYGTGWIKPSPCGMPYTVYAPLVPRKSEAYKRCVWGVVVDPDNQPVSGALVRCRELYPPGGEKVYTVRCQSTGVDTDQRGRFRLYLPIEESSLQIGAVIPPNTKYAVTIEPAKKAGLLPFEGEILNGQENRITLERAGYFRTFIFENQDGPITDPRKLRRIRVTIKRPGKPDLLLKYDDWNAEGVFPLGKFEARTSRVGGYKFEPVDVTTDSPEQLVFKIPTETRLYYGQVIDGMTNKPIKGAFVIDFKGLMEGIDLSPLTAEQWNALHELPVTISKSEKRLSRALSPVCNKYYLFEQAVRTDVDGWFEISLPVATGIEELMVFEKDYLGAKVALSSAKQDSSGEAKLPVTKLFPAAKIAFEPWLEGDRKDFRRILREWLIDRYDSPVWATDLIGWCSKDGQVDRLKGFSVDADEVLSFYVPAGLKLRIQLRVWRKYQWSPTFFAEVDRLEQGQEFALSRHEIHLGIPVFVETVDSMGQPIEAAPVKACDQYGQVTHNSDANGISIFELARNSKGEFVVEYKPAEGTDGPHLREAMPFEITGITDANTVFTMQLSDEILEALFK